MRNHRRFQRRRTQATRHQHPKRQFLAEVRGLKYKNVAAELLAKLLGDEIKVRSKRNLVQSREFSEMLKKTLNAYHNRAIATQEVIEELIKLAKQ